MPAPVTPPSEGRQQPSTRKHPEVSLHRTRIYSVRHLDRGMDNALPKVHMTITHSRRHAPLPTQDGSSRVGAGGRGCATRGHVRACGCVRLWRGQRVAIPRVDRDVLVEVVGARKRLLADVALERSLPRVRATVPHQFIRAQKPPLAIGPRAPARQQQRGVE